MKSIIILSGARVVTERGPQVPATPVEAPHHHGSEMLINRGKAVVRHVLHLLTLVLLAATTRASS